MMRRHRRSAATVLRLAAMALAAIAGGSAQAQTVYPERVIKMIVPSPAGGQTDVMARLMAQKMQQSLGQSVIIENRAGAGGALGARTAAAAEPDGYTLFYGNTSTLAVIPAVSKNAGYDPVKNYAPVASVSESYMILVVHPSFPARTIQEFLAYAKANPGKLNYASSGVGAGPHLATELFASMAEVKLTHVPYRGDTPALTDLVAGQVQMSFMSMAPAVPHVKSGALRALAVASAKRFPSLPDVPTVAEAGLPGYDVGSWWGLVAPAGTPREIIQRAEGVVVPFLREASTAARFLEMGLEPGELGAEAFQRYIAAEKDKLADIVKRAGIQAE